ncbi:MAG TPA: dihydropteroate synthase [Thermoanaerobaculia bacterium]
MTVTATRPPTRSWTLRLPGGRELTLGGRPRVMGILNLTPDSFSDGGLWVDPGRAVDHALAMAAAGAELLDLGAESTRPGGGVYGGGAPAVDAEEEWRRLAPVLAALRRRIDLPLSVDTRKGEVARRALAEGADLVNDVTALADPAAARAVADAGCPVVLMHSRGETATMQRHAVYGDVVAEVRRELAAALDRAERAGVDREQTLLDPGIGFAKGGEHNVALLARLDELAELGRPLLVGASRKAFLGRLTGVERPGERLAGSLAAALWSASRGAAIVRVHDVGPTRQALDAWAAFDEARGR